MILEIKIPSPGESITEVEIGKWLVEDDSLVSKDQEIAEIESDKATLSLTAPISGKIKILIKEGERISVGSIACTIDGEKLVSESEVLSETKTESTNVQTIILSDFPLEVATTESEKSKILEPANEDLRYSSVKFTPAAREAMKAEGISIDDVLSGIRRLNQKDIEHISDLLKQKDKEKSIEPKVKNHYLHKI